VSVGGGRGAPEDPAVSHRQRGEHHHQQAGDGRPEAPVEVPLGVQHPREQRPTLLARRRRHAAAAAAASSPSAFRDNKRRRGDAWELSVAARGPRPRHIHLFTAGQVCAAATPS
jgi:hypothetical protein